MKVSVGIVHGQEIDSWFFHSMIGLLTQANPTTHVLDNHVCIRSGPLLSMGRGVLAGTFLENTDSDALLMLDSDMKFDTGLIYTMIDLFERLRGEYPNLGVLGGLAFISSDPRNQKPKPNVWAGGKHPGQLHEIHDYPQDALMEVGGTGGACLLIAREVLEKFAAEKINPFHHIPILNWEMLARNVMGMDDWNQATQEIRRAVWDSDQLGEDMSFCARVRDIGYRVFVHTGLKFDHSKATLLGEPEFRKAYGLDELTQETVPVEPESEMAQEVTV